MIKKYVIFYKNENINRTELSQDFNFQDLEYLYCVSTQDSSGCKEYYTNTKAEAWDALNFLLLGGLYQVYSKNDNTDDMIPY